MRALTHPFRPIAVTALLFLHGQIAPGVGATLNSVQADYTQKTLPILKEFCLGCHSTEKHKGDLDLERFTSLNEIIKQPKVWQGVLDQVSLGEMPPAEKPQLSAAQKQQLQSWVNSALDAAAQARTLRPRPGPATPARSFCAG